MRLALYAVLLISSLSISAPEIRATEIGIEIGNQAPSFALKDLAGKTTALSDYHGKVVLLNFWSTLCEPCTAEMPSLSRLHISLVDKGLEVIAVSIDASDRPVKKFVDDKHIGFTILRDGDKEIFFDVFASPLLPVTYLIGRRGFIIEKFSGPQDWDSPEIKKKITKFLSTQE